MLGPYKPLYGLVGASVIAPAAGEGDRTRAAEPPDTLVSSFATPSNHFHGYRFA